MQPQKLRSVLKRRLHSVAFKLFYLVYFTRIVVVVYAANVDIDKPRHVFENISGSCAMCRLLQRRFILPEI